MKRRRKSPGQILNEFFARASQPSSEQLELSRQRMLLRLGLPRPSHVERSQERPQTLHVVKVGVAVAAVIAMAAGIGMLRSPEPALDSRAMVETVEGTLYRVISRGESHVVQVGEKIESGTVIRSNGGDGSVLALGDGSRVEMRSQTELLVERADDGLRIRLNTGSIIVNARRWHLRVQTNGLAVSGTEAAFLVNVGHSDSQVAVIQGQVQIDDGETRRTFKPGEQVSTNPLIGSRPFAEEIAWSRNAAAHMALLEASLARMRPPAVAPPIAAQTEAKKAPAPTAPLRFAAVSIRPSAGGAPGTGTTGFGCRGVDGTVRANFGEMDNPGWRVPQGRCVGNAVSLARFIGLAFGIPHSYGPGTPDWVRPYRNPTGPPATAVIYQIEAVAENAATVTTEQLKQMMQSMLVDRFQMKYHREMQEVPGYALVIAKNGLKIKQASGEEQLPVADFSTLGSRGGPTLRGKSTLDKLILFIVAFSNPIGFVTSELPSIVVDKTGLSGMYEYALVLPVPGGGQRSSNPAPQGIPGDRASQSFAWRGPALAEALEDQLGLRLQPERIRTEVIVVDQVERPGEN